MEFTDLPDDVLHIIFSFLPLGTVLRLECVCKRLQSSALFYLSTLKSIDPFSYSIQDDIFREWNDEGKLSPSQLLICLRRCPRATCITHIPGPRSSSSNPTYCKEVGDSIKCFSNIITIHFLDNQELLKEFLAQNLQINFSEVHVALHNNCVSSSQLSSVPFKARFKHTRILHIEDVKLDPLVVKQFLCCSEMTFIRCLITPDRDDSLKELSLPNVEKFVYVEEPGNPASSRIFSRIVTVVVKNEKLRVLHLGLNRFSILDGVASSWLPGNVEDLEITSTGSSYSTALQQLKYAPIVAGICQKSRASLQRICLPSTIVVKQFFEQLISRGCVFHNLKSFETTGIADTKMFLVPGQAVEALFYQEFIKLCPQIMHLSLDSFSGALASLSLPMTICSVILPWDNRLDFEKQNNDIEACVSFLPNLSSLAIFGVEEVEALLERNNTSKGSLTFSSDSLIRFRIKNASLKNLDLANCQNLSNFSMHCCPAVVSLPTESIQNIQICTGTYEKLEEFITTFLLVKRKNKKQNQVACHIHAQLHSISECEEEILPASQDVKKAKKFRALQQAIFDFSEGLDYWVFMDKFLHEFEHNSGESMYPFTEYMSPGSIASARSKTEILLENCHRDKILEGISRWKTCISRVKATASLSSSSEDCGVFTFDTRFCSRQFRCLTNLHYISQLNADDKVCQASDDSRSLGLDYEVRPSGDCFSKSIPEKCDMQYLNVPRTVAQPSNHFATLPRLSCSSNPLVFVSFLEYSHHIHRLFYYD